MTTKCYLPLSKIVMVTDCSMTPADTVCVNIRLNISSGSSMSLSVIGMLIHCRCRVNAVNKIVPELNV